MADNRNQGSDYRFTNQEWDNDYNRQQRNWEERNQGNQGWQENRDYGYSGNSSRYNRMNEEGNRWNRDRGNDFGQRPGNESNMGGQSRNYGYGGREYGSSYGGGNYMGNSSYYDSGSYGDSSGRSSFGSNRGLYDRDYERFDRGFSGYSGQGGGDYSGNYENRGRRSYDENPYYGSTNYRNYYGGNQGRDERFGRGDRNERSWWDRTRDEVSSWFGDEEAERRRERDERMNYRGRGPKNYTRSDERIKEDINDRLSDDPWIDASEIDVTVNKGEVTLAGTVNDRSEKRRAEDLAEAVSGVKNVENRLRVGKTTGTGSYTTSDLSATQTGTTGTSATTATDKNKSKTSYVTG